MLSVIMRSLYWITLLRAIFAVVLGVALIAHVEASRQILVNFIGMFWLITGIVSLRAGPAEGFRFRPLHVAAAIAGIIGGLMVVLRWGIISVADTWFDSENAEVLVIVVLALVILFTGLLHTVSGVEKLRSGHGVLGSGFILGIFEVVIGLEVLITPVTFNSVFYWAAIAWAIVGGISLFIEALQLRAASRLATDDVNSLTS